MNTRPEPINRFRCTDKHKWDSQRKNFYLKIFLFFFLSVLIRVHPWLDCLAFAGQVTPTADDAFDAAAKELDKAKDETQRLKDAWDKARLETTLYDQRAKRAYQRWAKAVKSAKEKARLQKERAELELQLAIEKRKLAFNEWQAAQLYQASREAQVKALDQEKESMVIRGKIKQLQEKLKDSSQPTVDSRQQNSK
jgi:hypothetical protein